jgi:hypothetical protein
LNGLSTDVFDLGINYFMAGNHAKISLDLQNRPTYQVEGGEIRAGERLNNIVMQYQIFF